MRVLYIVDFLYFTDGGAHVSACAHRDTLFEIYGRDNVDIISLTGPVDTAPQNGETAVIRGERNRIKQFINCVSGYTTYLNKRGIKTIINCISDKNQDVIFIDNSIFGLLVKEIKNQFPEKPVVTYYHDVKASLAAAWKKKAPIYKKPVYQAMIYSERVNQKYSDVNLTLNPRETNLFIAAYGKKPELELGVYMDVPLKEKYENSSEHFSVPLKLLFVGSHYLPNVKGIIWFMDNVLPNLETEVVLTVAGSHMEELKREVPAIPDNVTIMGHVDDLSALYEEADVIISPIFEGGGMKVKVTHASAYGKVIIGTDESYEGYQENIRKEQWDKYFYRCNTKEDFIRAISLVAEDSSLKKMNTPIRKYFEDYYSSDYARKTIVKAVQIAIDKVSKGSN